MELPEMKFVNSSTIESIGYDNQNQIVFLRFLTGSLYVYKGVPEHEYNNLIDAPSCGSYLHYNYKNVYPYERIE